VKKCLSETAKVAAVMFFGWRSATNPVNQERLESLPKILLRRI
jgi:hypothetical protein